jgi:hypothetical protein
LTNKITNQVDDSRHWIQQDAAGIDAFPREFQPFINRNKPEPAENIHGTWKQYSGRKNTVPGTVVFQIFPVTGLTQELVSFQSETH